MGHRLRRRLAIATWAAFLLGAGNAFAQEAAPAAAPVAIDSGDVAWVLTSSAIVLMMTIPGLGLFYGGLVRTKNVLSVLMQCLATAAVVSVTWVLWGYSIAFGPDHGGVVGDLSLFALQGVSWERGTVSESIPDQAFMVFQLMFAIITPALIVGSFAERMKFSAFLLLVIFWSTFVYSPLAHWVWGGGWLGARGALDFAGGTVVHISSGTSALVAAAMIGRRRGHGREPMPPHNVPFVVAGAALLWVGWFGFNAGSALAANGIATVAFVNTNTAAGSAVIGWLFSEWVGKGKPTAVGAATGAVAGLVAITPAAGFVEPWAAILIGLVAGWLCYKACNWKNRVGYDDALDVVGVHGVGGTWGAIATGLFASPALSDGGFFTGNPQQLLTQLEGIGATIGLCLVGTFLILGLVNSVVGLRVEDEDEEAGLDLTLHAESAYATAGSGSPVGQRAPRQTRSSAAAALARIAEGPASEPASLSPAWRPVRREPPRPASGEAGALAGGDGSKPFQIVVEGVEPRTLTRWWRDLCAQDFTKAPPAFRDIHPQVRSFEGTTFRFRGGDPAATRERLAYLLEVYGAQPSDLRVEEGR